MSKTIQHQILQGAAQADKKYGYAVQHDPSQPADIWFQMSNEGLVLFIVFFTQACRWSRCLGCNLPSKMSPDHIDFKHIIRQIDNLFSRSDVISRCHDIRKVIISNNGSILDEGTFSSTALMYLMAKLNLHLPNLDTVNIETRPEYVDLAELEFLSRSLAEGDTPTRLELAIGFEAYDEVIRNDIFLKGLTLEVFENLVGKIAVYGFRLKCYFMQKPVPGMSDKEAVEDIWQAARYLGKISRRHRIPINIHLNPTYVAAGTVVEQAFLEGRYSPPYLHDVAQAVYGAKDESVSVFVGLFDEGLAVPNGSFIRPGDEPIVERLEYFNRTQDFDSLPDIFSWEHPHEK